jgi:predicted Zn finger-like uncharacterized protein
MLSDQIIISCPRCETKYCISQNELNRRRLVRCNECSHIWHENALKGIEANPASKENFKAEEEKPKKDKSKKLKFILSAFLIICLGSGLAFSMFFLNYEIKLENLVFWKLK